jgi:hypothetical protein
MLTPPPCGKVLARVPVTLPFQDSNARTYEVNGFLMPVME